MTPLHPATRRWLAHLQMLYRDGQEKRSPEWITFQRQWVRPQIVGSKL